MPYNKECKYNLPIRTRLYTFSLLLLFLLFPCCRNSVAGTRGTGPACKVTIPGHKKRTTECANARECHPQNGKDTQHNDMKDTIILASSSIHQSTFLIDDEQQKDEERAATHHHTVDGLITEERTGSHIIRHRNQYHNRGGNQPQNTTETVSTYQYQLYTIRMFQNECFWGSHP